MKTLIIVSHPYPEKSIAIKSLENAASKLPDVTIRNLESLYGNDMGKFDIAAEQAACAGKDRIVFMFPIHWFNLTPMLKAYLNTVWTYGWAFGPEGKALTGKEMLVVTTAGATEYTYSPEGLVQSTIQDVLTPMKASALYIGMKYLEPLYFFEAMGASDEKIALFEKQLVERLSA
jgi:glutathione-regulated potassium-efflux system ancillary protein KefF